MRGDESVVVVVKRVEVMVVTVTNATEVGDGTRSTSTLGLIFTELGEHAG